MDSNTLLNNIHKHNREIMRHISEDKYLEWMNDYFHSADEDEENNYQHWVDFLVEAKNNKNDPRKLFMIWNSMLEGRLGMHVRNYMREHHPIIDVDFQLSEDQINWEDETFLDYGAFEDYSWELIQKLVNKMEKGEIN